MNEKPGSADDLNVRTRTSRRKFLMAPVGAAAVAATLVEPSRLFADAPAIPSIRIPKEVPASLNEKTQVGSFADKGMTGAEVFAKLCKEEDLAAFFCCPGNYTVMGAIAATGIPSYGGRTEGGMCAAADGFSRVTGEVTAASGTEGPGFTNMIVNIASANAARTPLLILASNRQISGDDRETYIQQAYQQSTTASMRKYGKRLITPNRVHEYGAYAFRQLKSGVPGPVHLDFPGEVARARYTDASELSDYYDKTKYRTDARPHPSRQDMEKAMDLISKAERPVLIGGQGVFQRKAWDELKQAAEKQDIAVVTSGPTAGHFPDDHRLSASLSPDALMSADLVVFVGQYCMPSPGEYHFNPDVKVIRVHPVQEDLGRNWPLDLGIVSDEKVFLEMLCSDLPQKKRDAWVAELAAARQAFEKENLAHYELGLKYSRATDRLHPAVLAKEAHDFLYQGDIDPKQTVTGYGGWLIAHYTSRWLRGFRPGQKVCCPYQYYAIGPDLAMMMGAGAAVQRGVGPQAPYKGSPVFVITSDAGIAYSLFEMDTAAKYKIPMVAVVYNNNAWGTWPMGAESPRTLHMHLFQENLRYDVMATGLGARGEYVHTPEQFREALKGGYLAATRENASTLINCQGMKEFSSAKDYPPGVFINPEPGAAAYAH
jgi:thiamine pyrophosphate-dependent acetolactate synthase large subunit-like protein